jgi:hypothetical protein
LAAYLTTKQFGGGLALCVVISGLTYFVALSMTAEKKKAEGQMFQSAANGAGKTYTHEEDWDLDREEDDEDGFK